MNDSGDLLGNRELHPILISQRQGAADGEDALGDPRQAGSDVLPGHAGAEQLASAPVP